MGLELLCLLRCSLGARWLRQRRVAWARFLGVTLAASPRRTKSMGFATAVFSRCALCGMLDAEPTAAARDASDACPKHSRTPRHGALAPLGTETYSKTPYCARRSQTRGEKSHKKSQETRHRHQKPCRAASASRCASQQYVTLRHRAHRRSEHPTPQTAQRARVLKESGSGTNVSSSARKPFGVAIFAAGESSLCNRHVNPSASFPKPPCDGRSFP